MNDYAFHPEAFTDLADIWEFIAEDNIDAADRLIRQIFDAIGALTIFRGQGYRRPDITARPLRFLRVRSYLIAYAPEEDPLLVIAVLHGRRSPRVMAALLRGRE